MADTATFAGAMKTTHPVVRAAARARRRHRRRHGNTWQPKRWTPNARIMMDDDTRANSRRA